jgi:hypothetical protein
MGHCFLLLVREFEYGLWIVMLVSVAPNISQEQVQASRSDADAMLKT